MVTLKTQQNLVKGTWEVSKPITIDGEVFNKSFIIGASDQFVLKSYKKDIFDAAKILEVANNTKEDPVVIARLARGNIQKVWEYFATEVRGMMHKVDEEEKKESVIVQVENKYLTLCGRWLAIQKYVHQRVKNQER